MTKQRIVLLIGLIFLGFGVIELKLFGLQLIRTSYYRDQALKRSIRLEIIPALRGKILDRQGEALVHDTCAFDLFIILREFNKIRRQQSVNIELLAQLLNLSERDIGQKIKSIEDKTNHLLINKTPRELKRIKARRYNTPYKIVSGIPRQVALEIASYPERFPGFVIRERNKRYYAYNNLACHIVGYLSPIWDKKEYKKLLRQGFFRQKLNPAINEETYELIGNLGVFLDEPIGRSGIEKKYEQLLAGMHGARFMEHDFITGEERELSRISSIPGKDICLTIDKSLQTKITSLLSVNNKVGSVIIMDVTNGEVWVMASTPDFNPNSLQRPVAPATVQYIFHNPKKPLLSRAISGAYALGSVFKIVVACAGLSENKITPYTPFTCSGRFFKRSKYFKCWIAAHGLVHGSLELTEALQCSCNIFFFHVGKLLGPDLLNKWTDNFELGRKTGIDLPEEQAGLVPTPDWKKRRYHQKWAISDTLNLSIGQGDLMVTPIQVVRIMAAIANGGYLVGPHLVKAPLVKCPKTKLNIKPEYLQVIREGLYAVVHKPGGTANKLGLNKFPIGGKTSTAQVSFGDGQARKPHSWFAGFGPYNNPRFAFVVMIEHGGKGSTAATPVAAKFIQETLELSSRIAAE